MPPCHLDSGVPTSGTSTYGGSASCSRPDEGQTADEPSPRRRAARSLVFRWLLPPARSVSRNQVLERLRRLLQHAQSESLPHPVAVPESGACAHDHQSLAQWLAELVRAELGKRGAKRRGVWARERQERRLRRRLGRAAALVVGACRRLGSRWLRDGIAGATRPGRTIGVASGFRPVPSTRTRGSQIPSRSACDRRSLPALRHSHWLRRRQCLSRLCHYPHLPFIPGGQANGLTAGVEGFENDRRVAPGAIGVGAMIGRRLSASDHILRWLCASSATR